MVTAKDPDRTQEEALVRLVSQYQGALLRLCYVYLGDRALAEDATQETFLKAYRNLNGFRGEASEKTWLMKIAVNTCRDLQRSAWFRHTDRTVTPEELPEPEAQASVRDKEITLEVMRLPAKLREVVLLYYYQNLSAVETAHALGISQQAVSGRLARARKRLRVVLEGSVNDE